MFRLKRTIKVSLILLNMAIAFILMVANTAPFTNPSNFHLMAFLGLGFGIVLLINLGFLLFWILNRKIYFLISFVVLLFSWPNITKLFAFTDTVKPGEKIKTHKILSYNVKNFDFYNWKEDQKNRNAILEFINEKQPDIITFQEFFDGSKKGWNNAVRLVDSLGYTHHYFVPKVKIKSRGENYGLATFSKYPFINKQHIPFYESKTNAALFTDIKIDKDTVRVYNVHLQSIHLEHDEVNYENFKSYLKDAKPMFQKLKRAYIARSEQVELLQKQVKNSPYPVLLAGDFNDTPISYAYETIAKVLNDNYLMAGFGFGGTYNGPLPSFRIDYIFSSKDFKTIRFNKYNLTYSDHQPIISTFYLK